MSEQSTFDPRPYMTQVNGRDYLEVKWRLVWLRSVHPDASIETELVEHNGTQAVFKARVSVIDGPSATGWGSESEAGFHDYLEKAETKALGRALAALGFGTQFSSDYDFGAERDRVVDAPVGRPETSQESAIVKLPATSRQVNYLYIVSKERGLNSGQLNELALAAYGVEVAELDRRSISEFIERLRADEAEASAVS